MPKRLIESQAFASTETSTPGRLRLQLITPGWGSSGFYSRDVLETAAKDKVWPAGTHIYFDHPTESEMYDRPERSVRDLAAILSEDAYTDTSGGLVGEADVIGPYRALMTDDTFIRAVGMSIRASADTAVGEAEGRKGTIVTRLIEGQSVDVVTRAGRGGRILAAVESARAAMTQEATANDTREELERAVRAEHGSDDDQWIYVRDFDGSNVWFAIDSGDESAVWQQAYTLTDGAVTLAGERTEVRVRTEYVPVSAEATEAARAVQEARNVGQWVESRIHRDFTVMADDMAAEGRLTREERIGLSSAIGDALAAFVTSLEATQPQLYQRDPWDEPTAATDASEASTKPPVTPAGSTTHTHNSEEENMGTTQIEESRLAQLEADAGRVQTLESERDAANAERDQERAARLATENRAAAIEAIADSGHDFTRLERRGLLASLPVTEAGELDAEAFTTALTEAAAESRTTAGTGTVTGFGGSTTDDGKDYTAEADKVVAGAFGRTVKGA